MKRCLKNTQEPTVPDSVFCGLGISLVFGTVVAVIASIAIAPILLYYVEFKILDKA